MWFNRVNKPGFFWETWFLISEVRSKLKELTIINYQLSMDFPIKFTRSKKQIKGIDN